VPPVSMQKKSLSIMAALIILLMAASASKAEVKDDSKLFTAYRGFIQGRGNTAQGFAALSQLFSSLDQNGDGISAQELNRAETISNARMRALFAQMNLMYDLDGDLVVTQQEVETVLDSNRLRLLGGNQKLKAQLLRRRAAQIQSAMAGDANNNGSLEGKELLAAPPKNGTGEFRRGMTGQYELVHALLDADPNSDGLLTEAEALALLATVADKAKDAQGLPLMPAPQGDDNCQAIEVDKDSDLILVGAYEGSQVSTVTMAGQDEDTTSASLIIEKGSKPLTVVLSSFEAMVWTFSGDVGRIDKVVAVSGKENPLDGNSAVGIVGIPREKVEFFKSPNCLQNAYREGSGAQAHLSALAGAKLAKFVPEYEIGALSLPSGQNNNQETNDNLVIESLDNWAKRQTNNRLAEFSNAKAAVDLAQLNWMAKNVIRFNPRGIADFELKDVVSVVKAENYQVLPQQSGLLQLVKAGAMTIDECESSGGSYRVVGPMRYPAGLGGSHSVNFTVKHGVEAPTGDPVHSEVKFSDQKEAPEISRPVCK
jgi:hypothetical protein